ncbi:T-cell receptor beta chain V region PHDS203 [Fukomys damarensis]|nr:T-cell receptor beta chain V region PHDS203 [Fukomys damarensis]
MAARLLCCLAFCFFGADADISQIPRYCITGIGKKIILECAQTMGHNKMYWYRQDPGRELKLIHYSYGVNTTEKGEVSSESMVSRERTEHFPLTLESASPTHTSQYFCASSDYTVLRVHLHPAQKRYSKVKNPAFRVLSLSHRSHRLNLQTPQPEEPARPEQ